MHHLIFGQSRRSLCDYDRLLIPLCDTCHTLGSKRLHDNSVAEYLSKAYGQALWEKQEIVSGCSADIARDRFIKRYGKNWISEGL